MELINLNWENKINECQRMINQWNRRYLTFYGKTSVIKSLLLPKIAYLIQSIPTPKYVISKLNTMVFQFLWSNKKEKIKRVILIGPKNSGGLDVPDVESYCKSLKMKWVKLLLEERNENWKVIPKFLFNQYGPNLLIFDMNVDSLKSLPNPKIALFPFYQELLEHFIEFNRIGKERKPDTFFEIRKQVIWGNQYIKFSRKSLLYRHWAESGIIFIEDIIHNGVIDENLILRKLRNKMNWASEIYKLK